MRAQYEPKDENAFHSVRTSFVVTDFASDKTVIDL